MWNIPYLLFQKLELFSVFLTLCIKIEDSHWKINVLKLKFRIIHYLTNNHNFMNFCGYSYTLFFKTINIKIIFNLWITCHFETTLVLRMINLVTWKIFSIWKNYCDIITNKNYKKNWYVSKKEQSISLFKASLMYHFHFSLCKYIKRLINDESYTYLCEYSQ